MELGLVNRGHGLVDDMADPDRFFGAARDAGFGSVTVLAHDTDGRLPEVAAALRRHGLRCSDVMSLTVKRDDEATIPTAHALRPVVHELGAEYLQCLVWSSVSQQTIDRVGEAADIVGVPLAIEASAGPVATIDQVRTIVEALGTSRARVMVDTYHFFRSGSTWEMVEQLPLDELSLIQFNDAPPAISDDYFLETTQRRTWPGDGEFDLGRFSTTLLDRGWDGTVAVELPSVALAAVPLEEFAARAYATSVRYWQRP
jgi:sugar phosphate isomerase/epimerase